MRSIITISREFGSGGREIGKKLADDLGIPFYDIFFLTCIYYSIFFVICT